MLCQDGEMCMTEQEIMTLVQESISSGKDRSAELKILENSTSGLEQYKITVAVRMLRFWFQYLKRCITKQDFESSLRSYLLVWNTDIMLYSYRPDEDSAFGLQLDPVTGRVYVNYKTPTFFNDQFLKAAYMHGYTICPQTDSRKYNLCTNARIHALTGFSKYKTMEQKLAVAGALKTPDGYTTLIAMLTGGGKSLITQTVAYQKEQGLTIVIVPTISLMMDQERNAKEIIRSDVENEIFSYYSGKDITPFYRALHRGTARLLFVSPEALMKNKQLREELFKANSEHRINNLIVDEAHIVIEWGTSFRVDYQCLDALQRNMLAENPALRTFLLSATYSKDTVKQLRSFFSDGEHWIEIRCDRLRHEPRYQIIKADSYSDKREKLRELAATLPRPMIIYVNAPESATRVQCQLKAYGIENTHVFTGQTSTSEREKLIQKWADHEFDLMIATCAFGVGVDKRDVRTVLHLYVPENPNKYYQEAGRGGRDGLPCLSVLLYTGEDLDSAFQRMQKVLTTDKLKGRWFSMLTSEKAIRKHGEIVLDTSVKPSYNDSDEFWTDVSDIDISWNVYVLLLLRRNHLIDILDVSYQDNRYLFRIRILVEEIVFDTEETKMQLERIRNTEWDQVLKEYGMMQRALQNVGKDCWSEMFNEVYHLTTAYCAGCNAHDTVTSDEDNKLPLLQSIQKPFCSMQSSASELMDHAAEMLVITEEPKHTLQCLLGKKTDVVVLPRNSVLFDTAMACQESGFGCLLMNYEEFIALSSRGMFYLSGHVTIFLPEDESMIDKLLLNAQKLKRCSAASIVYATQEDQWIERRRKRLSELIDGPCKQAYIIERE